MKNNTKSSITLPHDEVVIIDMLMKKLKLKSRVSVIRKAIAKLKEDSEREALKEEFRKASLAIRAQYQHEIEDLDSLSSEGLDED